MLYWLQYHDYKFSENSPNSLRYNFDSFIEEVMSANHFPSELEMIQDELVWLFNQNELWSETNSPTEQN